MDKATEIDVRFGLWNLPRKATQCHAKEYHSNPPHIRLLRVVWLTAEDFWCQIRIRANNTSGLCWSFARVMEHGCRAKIDELDNIFFRHNTIVQLEITMGQSHAVQVIDTVNNLACDTINFRPGHLARHDNAKEVIRSIFHDLGTLACVGVYGGKTTNLIKMTMVADNLDGFDNV